MRVLVDGTPARPSDALLTSRTLDFYPGTESFTFVLDLISVRVPTPLLFRPARTRDRRLPCIAAQ